MPFFLSSGWCRGKRGNRKVIRIRKQSWSPFVYLKTCKKIIYFLPHKPNRAQSRMKARISFSYSLFWSDVRLRCLSCPGGEGVPTHRTRILSNVTVHKCLKFCSCSVEAFCICDGWDFDLLLPDADTAGEKKPFLIPIKGWECLLTFTLEVRSPSHRPVQKGWGFLLPCDPRLYLHVHICWKSIWANMLIC